MRIQGIVTKATTRKSGTRKNPRPGEDPNYTVHETVVVDDTLGQTVTLTEWSEEPKFHADKSAEIDVAVSALRLGAYGMQATIITDSE